MGLKTAFNKPEVVIGFSEEGRTLTGLFAGFSLVFLAMPISEGGPSRFDLFSLCVSGISTVFLVATAYVFSLVATIAKIEAHQGDDHTDDYIYMNLDVIKVATVLTGASILGFLANIVLVGFRVHDYVGLSVIVGILLVILVGKFSDRIIDLLEDG